MGYVDYLQGEGGVRFRNFGEVDSQRVVTENIPSDTLVRTIVVSSYMVDHQDTLIGDKIQLFRWFNRVLSRSITLITELLPFSRPDEGYIGGTFRPTVEASGFLLVSSRLQEGWRLVDDGLVFDEKSHDG